MAAARRRKDDTAGARQLRDGDVIAGDGWTVRCVHTPGHTSNHVCFRLDEEEALFSGDHVMGWNTTIMVPPDGDMGAYLAKFPRKPRDSVIKKYRIDFEEPVYDDTGVARGYFFSEGA